MRNEQNQKPPVYPHHEWVPPSQSGAAQIRFYQAIAKQEEIKKIYLNRKVGSLGVYERRPSETNLHLQVQLSEEGQIE